MCDNCTQATSKGQTSYNADCDRRSRVHRTLLHPPTGTCDFTRNEKVKPACDFVYTRKRHVPSGHCPAQQHKLKPAKKGGLALPCHLSCWAQLSAICSEPHSLYFLSFSFLLGEPKAYHKPKKVEKQESQSHWRQSPASHCKEESSPPLIHRFTTQYGTSYIFSFSR